MPSDYYALLGVSRDATEEEIKRAYRKLARELHPDMSGGDREAEERFKEVTLAYETLRDPEKRRRYDLFGPDGVKASAPTAEDVFTASFGDIFEAVFGQSPFGAAARRGPVPGDDLEVTLELSFEEAVFGAEKDLKISAPVVCSSCGGSGARRGTTPVVCPSCRGSGEIRRVRQSIFGQMVTTSVCPSCRGEGEVVNSPCPDCRGEGRRIEEKVYKVDVPAGVDDGATLRLSGRGGAGWRGGPPGNLYVHLKVRPHPRIRRVGNDLVTTEHIAMTSAALGTELEIETLDGTEVISVPAGTQSGTVFRLKGKGVPHLQARGRGDLLVEVVVDTPLQLTPEQEELLRQFAALRNEPVAPIEDPGLFQRLRSRLR
jgi:molecular chaperone DnaJ